MKLIPFTTRSGEPCHLNAWHVEFLTRSGGGTSIRLSGGGELIVNESVNEVISALAGPSRRNPSTPARVKPTTLEVS